MRTVGSLAAAVGASLGVAVLHGRRSPETVALALGSGLVFGLADLRAARTESAIYLGDVAVQLALASAWLAPWTGSLRAPGAGTTGGVPPKEDGARRDR